MGDSTAIEIADVLERAAKLIEPEGAWCQRDFSRTVSGESAGLSELFGPAVCWCVLGATAKADPENFGSDADQFLSRFLGGVNLDEWNDAPERTQEEVVETLRKAAAKARGDQS